MAAIREFYRRMVSTASERRFWLCPLGEVDGLPIWLVRTRLDSAHKYPKILIVAGFHGEEKAGPYATLEWLSRDNYELLQGVDLSFLPIVNPIGFSRGIRYNTAGEVTNGGYCHPESGDTPSQEGQILTRNIDLIRPLASYGCLSLHEDASCDSYYVYDYCQGTDVSPTAKAILVELGKHFSKRLMDAAVLADTKRPDGGPRVTDGVVFHYCDGSFEDWMYHLGIPKVVVSETPGKYTLKRRVNAGVAVIDRFVSLCLTPEKKGRKQS